MTTILFPGQGSQFVGMGEDLFNKYPDTVSIANQVLGYSVEALCLEDKNNKLNNTLYTQPAIYVVSALSWLEQKNKLNPIFMLGHSVGEYAALFAAGVFDFETGLKIVNQRAHLMSQVNGGAMAALLNISSGKVKQLIELHSLDIEIANYNTPQQTVISGELSKLEAAKSIFEQNGAKFIRLNVSGPFHSSLMSQLVVEFAQYLNTVQFGKPRIKCISNSTGRPFSGNSEDLKMTMAMQLSKPVYWLHSIEYCLSLGETDFIEIGPNKVLTKMLNQIRDEQNYFS